MSIGKCLEERVAELEHIINQEQSKQRVVHLLHTYWRLLDQAMSDNSLFPEWAKLNCEDVVFNHPGSQMRGISNAVAWGKSMTADLNFSAGFHMAGNLEVNVEDDKATARNNLYCCHVRNGKEGPKIRDWFAEGGYYSWELRRDMTNEGDEYGGWRISKNELHVTWVLGDGMPL